ncbi:MAG: hypothetical protein LBK95_06050, partial [Bifidobacteriaceae bacterium]|nr:hypothetical protein [Bifidobacteriaceae bacterium]
RTDAVADRVWRPAPVFVDWSTVERGGHGVRGSPKIGSNLRLSEGLADPNTTGPPKGGVETSSDRSA